MRLLVVSLLLGVFASSCGEGSLKRRTPNIFQGQGGSDATPGSDVDTPESQIPVLDSTSSKELLPLRIKLPENEYYFVKESLPTGSVLNENGRELLWLPQKGEEGAYKLSVLNAAKSEFIYEVRIDAQSDDDMAIGPSAWYREGDIGFIYVHGMSQNDVCETPGKGQDYWLGTPDILGKQSNLNSIVCYDGRDRVETQARKVADQILTSSCGAYGRCVVLTHSMGGLMLEYILHRSLSGDTPAADRAAFQAVREKIAFVVSIASAAGGSKLANIVKYPDRYPDASLLANIVKPFLASGGAVDSLQVEFASQTVAPMDVDPKMPFFMIPGYSKEEGIGLNSFNGMYELGVLDSNAKFQSRSDGLVDFRSACGVASDREDDGPGRGTSLDSQFQYCFGAPKKPSHHVWFSINLNHAAIHQPFTQCSDAKNGCLVHVGKPGESYQASPELTGMDAVNIMRRLLFRMDMTDEAL